MSNKRGITSIALIITIIVMLILVGVTINVALNVNLFGKADEAKRLTQIAADKEELQIEILTAYNEKTGEVELSTLKTNLEAKGWKVTVSGDKAICTSPKGNTFTVDENGKITIGTGVEPSAFEWSSVGLTVDTSTEYISENGITLNFSADGKLTMLSNGVVITTVDATDTEKNVVDGKLTSSIVDEYGYSNSAVITMNANNTDVDFTIEGGSTVTYVKIVVDNKTIYSNEEVLKALGETGGRYKGTWTVIGTENGKTKLVSTSPVTSYTLGYEDKNATGADNLEKSIWSYKNAVNSLNTAAKEATGISSARSVNIGDIESLAWIEDSDKGIGYLNENKYNYTNSKDQVFVTENGETIKIDSSEKEVTLKHTQYVISLTAGEIGTLASGYYWLASSCVGLDSSSAYYKVYYMSRGNISNETLFCSSGYVDNDNSHCVRAVVSI